jgi:predicted nucleotidyltransferase
MQLGERFGVRNIRVFGSVARGEATSESDLDLLVDVDRGHGYFDMAGFALGVEDKLGVFTQVATLNGLKLRIRDRVLREAVAL